MKRIAYSILAASCAVLLIHSAEAGAAQTVQAPIAVDVPATTFGVAVDPAIALSEGTVGISVGVSITARASAGCADGKVCFWTQTDYDGSKETADADDAMVDRSLGAWDGSAKNRFGQRKVLIKNSSLGQIDCLDPDESRDALPSQAAFFRIGGVGSSC